MQRIGIGGGTEGDRFSCAMNVLKTQLENQEFERFVRLRKRQVVALGHGTIDINEFSPLLACIDDPNAYEILRRLRNAVAHGDARLIKPVNVFEGASGGYTLLGYRVAFNRLHRSAPAHVFLDHCGMSKIAEAISARFCGAVSAEYPEYTYFEADAKRLDEE